jgi:hypothetical protein
MESQCYRSIKQNCERVFGKELYRRVEQGRCYQVDDQESARGCSDGSEEYRDYLCGRLQPDQGRLYIDHPLTGRNADWQTLPQNLENEEVERIVKEIETEKEAEAERKKNRMAAVAQVRWFLCSMPRIGRRLIRLLDCRIRAPPLCLVWVPCRHRVVAVSIAEQVTMNQEHNRTGDAHGFCIACRDCYRYIQS